MATATTSATVAASAAPTLHFTLPAITSFAASVLDAAELSPAAAWLFSGSSGSSTAIQRQSALGHDHQSSVAFVHSDADICSDAAALDFQPAGTTVHPYAHAVDFAAQPLDPSVVDGRSRMAIPRSPAAR